MGIVLTPRELDVMGVLWELGEASVQQVREELDDTLAYTSVLSVLQLLEQKGHITHRKEGRSYRYMPLVEPEEAGETVLERILETLYRRSPVRLLAHLVEREELGEEDLRRMRDLLDRRLEEGP